MCVINGFIYPLECFLGIRGLATQDRNLRPGYNTLLLGSMPGDFKHVHTKL